MHTRPRLLAATGLLLALGFGVSSVARAQGLLAGDSVLAQPGALRITVDYQGSGTVSEDHQLTVFVFDTPNIRVDSVPIWTGQLADNQQTLTAGGIDASTVWVAVVFDEAGGYDPLSGPPPSGSPLALYSTDQTGMPTGVELKADQETEITIAFDDAFRMP